MRFSYPALKWALQRTAKHLLPEMGSLQKCYRTMTRPTVEVFRSGSRSTASYRGLCTCQNRWACPVCSAKISAHRAEEVTQGIANHRATGGTALLFTFTASHTREDTLSDLQTALRDALRRWTRSAPVKRVLSDLGFLGSITALEATFGHESGWHPHFHRLAFVSEDATPKQVQTLASQWVRACRRVGLVASEDHGFDLRGGEAAGEYVAKLGLEVALAVAKKGRRRGRFGVWELLAEARDGAAWAGLRFAEFARTMKGKHQLHWSDGLRLALGIDDEKTDEQIMAEGGDLDEVKFAQLTRELWNGVYRSELRGELLHLLGQNDVDDARDLLRAFGLDDSGLILEYCDTVSDDYGDTERPGDRHDDEENT